MKIEIANGHPSLRFPRNETRRIVRGVLAGEKAIVAEVTVVFTNSRMIRAINRMFLNHDYATDVIAFELEPKPHQEAEIYISLDKAKTQAKVFKTPFVEETRRLLIHGLLHIVGYRDTSPRLRATMSRREDQLLSILTQKNNARNQCTNEL
jgi:probable rRNA maturation factor